jgi:hypothetical protein
MVSEDTQLSHGRRRPSRLDARWLVAPSPSSIDDLLAMREKEDKQA